MQMLLSVVSFTSDISFSDINVNAQQLQAVPSDPRLNCGAQKSSPICISKSMLKPVGPVDNVDSFLNPEPSLKLPFILTSNHQRINQESTTCIDALSPFSCSKRLPSPSRCGVSCIASSLDKQTPYEKMIRSRQFQRKSRMIQHQNDAKGMPPKSLHSGNADAQPYTYCEFTCW